MGKRTFIIEGEKVSFNDEDLKCYSYLGECFYKNGEGTGCGLFLREDGKVIDPADLSRDFKILYDEEGKPLEPNHEFFLLDNTRAVEHKNKLYLVEALEEVFS